jgi:hypothetical protein
LSGHFGDFELKEASEAEQEVAEDKVGQDSNLQTRIKLLENGAIFLYHEKVESIVAPSEAKMTGKTLSQALVHWHRVVELGNEYEKVF